MVSKIVIQQSIVDFFSTFDFAFACTVNLSFQTLHTQPRDSTRHIPRVSHSTQLILHVIEMSFLLSAEDEVDSSQQTSSGDEYDPDEELKNKYKNKYKQSRYRDGQKVHEQARLIYIFILFIYTGVCYSGANVTPLCF